MIDYRCITFGKLNTCTVKDVVNAIKTWNPDKLFTQTGFSYKGARPSKATREQALKFNWEDACEDANGNLTLIHYCGSDWD